MNRKKHFLFLSIVVCLNIIVLLLIIIFIAEFIFILGKRYNVKYFNEYELSGMVYDRDYGWRIKKNLKTEIYYTNDKGFRDINRKFAKGKNVKRIIFLGDSYTFGASFKDNEIFTGIFNVKVKNHFNDTCCFDVMNISAPAWSTDQQYIYLKKEGIHYKPDYVFLMIAPNDIRETYAKKIFLVDDSERLIRVSEFIVPGIDRYLWHLSNVSYLFNFLQENILKTSFGTFKQVFKYFPLTLYVEGHEVWDFPLFLKNDNQEVIKAKKLFETLLIEMNNICTSNNCKFIAVIIPTKIEFTGKLNKDKYMPGKIANFINDIADRNNIHFIDLFRCLQEEPYPLKIYQSDDYHFSAYGHKWVANKIFEDFVYKKK